MENQLNIWWLYALLSALFAALTTIFAKIGIESIDSNLATALRTIVILLFAWSIVFVNGEVKSLSEIPPRTLIFLALSGVATGLSWIFYFRALQLGKASLVASIDKSSVVLVLLFSAAFLGEGLTVRSSLGIVLIVIGTLVLVL